jgi:hypothetical protein
VGVKSTLIRAGTALLLACALACALSGSALAADTIWWANYTASKVAFANLDGSGGGGDLNTSGATAPNQVAGVAIDAAAGRVYWANAGSGKISYANLDGSGGGGDLDTTGATVGGARGLAIDPALGRLYWGNTAGIWYANLDGSGGGSLNTGTASVMFPFGVAIDPALNRIYWANFNLSATPTNKISYTSLDGSGGGADLSVTGALVSGPKGVSIDEGGGRVYWTNSSASTALGKVAGADLDGSDGGDFNVTGAGASGNVTGPSLDPTANKIYWLGTDTNKLSFANLDRSGGVGDLSTGAGTINEPIFSAILKAPSPTGDPVVTGGSTTGSMLSCSTGSWAPDLLGAFLYRVPQSLAYAWTRDGTEIAGATGSTVSADSAGFYRCSVTASNAAGSGGPQTSVPFQVSAPPPPPTQPATGSAPATTAPPARKKCKKHRKRAAEAKKCRKRKR